MPKMFLSHSSRDKPIVTRLAQDLQAKGIDVWLDAWEILAGDSFIQRIQEGLQGADFVVLALSPHAVGSGWTDKEWQSRLDQEIRTREVRIIPILLADCQVPALLSDKHYADFRDDYEAGLATLVNAIEGHSARAPGAPAARPPTRLTPYEARVRVTRTDGKLSARWYGPEESDPSDLRPPLGRDELDALRWYLETYVQFAGAGDRARARTLEASMQQWGKTLFDALFDNRAGGAVESEINKAIERDRPVLLTLASDDPEVLGQPWEMLRNHQGPLTFQGVSLRRQLREAGHTEKALLDLPLRVLLIVSRPTDAGFIDPRNSIAPMLDALETLGPGQLQLDVCEPPTFPALEQRLAAARRQRRPYDIVHFDGHGTYLPKTGIGGLAFEKPDAKADLIAGPDLGDLMVSQRVPLVLLEACRGSEVSDRPGFGSVARALLKSGVGSVIAFSHSVHVEAARILVERFYQELAGGLTVGEALAEARRALHAKPARWLHLGPDAESIDLDDWFIPQLYQVGEDPALTRGTAAPAIHEVTQPQERMRGFPPEPVYRFHGRAQELLELARALRRQTAVLLHAMGGMGKTALARQAAHWWLRTGRFERAVFVSFEQWAGAEQVVQRLGLALEGESFGARSSEDQRRRAIRLFHERPVLLVWDNFESTLPTYQEGEPGGLGVYTDEARQELTALYRELTDGRPGGRLLVTCRSEETGLPGIKEVPLGGLARPDSLHLLAAVLDAKSIPTDRPGYERPDIEDLLNALADHPLSIALVTPHLKERTPRQILAEFGELLAKFTDDSSPERRNRSLLASLEFSKRRLGEAARAILPYLAWFQGGVLESCLIAFAQLDPERWQAARAELVATGLLRVEVLHEFSTPYLRFHPTLHFAALPNDVPDPETAEQRFIGIFANIMGQALNQVDGMRWIGLEEVNLRAAIRRMFRRRDWRLAQVVARGLLDFLERTGRLRERDRVGAWVREQAPVTDGLDAATCDMIRRDSWSLCQQGQVSEAIAMIEGLVDRLGSERLIDGADVSSEIAASYHQLGRLLNSAGRSDLAVKRLQQVITECESVGNVALLGDALGDLANALRHLGRLDEALVAAERCVAVFREREGHYQEVAISLTRLTVILIDKQRYADAQSCCSEASAIATAIGDASTQGVCLQCLGTLHYRQDNIELSVKMYQQALDFFRKAGNAGAEMRTANLLGSAESQRGELDAAAAWYERSRELANRLNDRPMLAGNALNSGILYATRGEQTEDPGKREAWLRRAIDSVKESLAIWVQDASQGYAASSYAQLGVLHRLLGELDEAERNACEALAICEGLNLPHVHRVYASLAEIARARGDEAAAAEWQAKCDAKLAELERLRRGNDQGAKVDEDVVKSVLALAQAACRARASGALAPESAEALTQMADASEPFKALGGFLQAVADRQHLPPVPASLPAELQKVVDALAEAIRQNDPAG